MQNLSVNSKNIDTVKWEEEYYKYCIFDSFTIEGIHVDSDFTDCTFNNIEWYWGIFNIVKFINCKFNNCVFKGTTFPDCLFVECEFNNCSFEKDNLDGDCEFENSRAYNCKVVNTSGFNATIRN
jgi:uncharacterized protein YjbI with pentapeptide repeats